ncbi:MAG: cell wall anchor protein, partial [Modestobacter sp.]|nr:cell wall anchor protein [Modestobacter sp.]
MLPTPDRLPGSRARRGRLAVTLVLTALTAGVLAVAPPPAVAAANGSLLLDDSFTGTSVANPEVLRLNAACLTAATSAPPAGASDLGECGKRSLSPSTSVTPGFLQLTDASATSTGGVVSTLPLPADGGVVVTFDQYQ